MSITHLSVDIKGLMRELQMRETDEDKNSLACAFFKPEFEGVEPRVEILGELVLLLKEGKKVFTSDACNNIQEDGSCGGHPDEQTKSTE